MNGRSIIAATRNFLYFLGSLPNFFPQGNAEDMEDEPRLTPFLKKLASTGVPNSHVLF